jgi:hypothetical protein
VAAAVRHLTMRQLEELREQLADAPHGRGRVRAGLDILFEQYSGRLFAAVVELSLAARGDVELHTIIFEEERNISRTMQSTATAIFGEGFPDTRDLARRWGTVLSAIRGLAMLKLLGHAGAAVDAQWRHTRGHLLQLLITDAD